MSEALAFSSQRAPRLSPVPVSVSKTSRGELVVVERSQEGDLVVVVASRIPEPYNLEQETAPGPGRPLEVATVVGFGVGVFEEKHGLNQPESSGSTWLLFGVCSWFGGGVSEFNPQVKLLAGDLRTAQIFLERHPEKVGSCLDL